MIDSSDDGGGYPIVVTMTKSFGVTMMMVENMAHRQERVKINGGDNRIVSRNSEEKDIIW